MPVKNGLQVVQEIKNFYRFQTIEVQLPTFVFCTAYATPSFSRHALSMGVSQVYEKPMHLETFCKIVQEVIGDGEI